MSDEGPKLFDHKPKKSARLKASPVAAESSTGPSAPPSRPPPTPSSPPPIKEPFLQRFTFYKSLALVVSLTVGVYAFARTVLKVGPYQDEKPESSTTTTTPSSTISTPTAAASITEEAITLPIVQATQRPPIPEDQQRELLKWMLEEKRKVKPRDAEEKKRLDEDKAVLKQFIRAKSLPPI